MRTVLPALVGAVLVLGCLSLSKVNASAEVAVSDDETATKARELWEKVLVAKGGRERLRKITNLYVAADQGQGYRQLTLTVFPDYRFDFSYDPKRENTAIEVSNARKGIVWWQVSNEAKPRKYEVEDVYRNLLPQVIYLLVTSDVDPVPLRLRKEWMGVKRVDVIEVEAQGLRVDYYIDPKTHLPLRVVSPQGLRARNKGNMDHIVTLDDYAALDGVMMPHKATHTFTYSSERLVERLKFEINAAYDPQVFEQAPTPRTSVEAWRAKK
jgi:hypothetical protein